MASKLLHRHARPSAYSTPTVGAGLVRHGLLRPRNPNIGVELV